jgi:hypothetical protein
MSLFPTSLRRIASRAALALSGALVLPGLLYLTGPVTTIDPRVRPVALPADLDGYLARSEAGYGDIVPGTEKTIVWASASKSRTPLSIVYLHGFSASRQECAPLPQLLARSLGANLYLTVCPEEKLGGVN